MKNIKDLFEKVRYYNSDGQSKTAFELLINATKNNSNLKKDIIFNLELGQTLLGLSQFNDALECFRKVLVIEKNNIYAQIGQLKCLNKLNKQIKPDLIKRMSEKNNDTDTRNMLYDICIKNYLYKEAFILNNNLKNFFDKINYNNIDKKIFLSIISYVKHDARHKEELLSVIFSNIINNRLYIEKNEQLKNFFINTVLKNIDHLCEDKKNIIQEYIFNYYYKKKSVYETINYLLKILKLDDTRDIFIKIICATLRKNNLTAYEKKKIIQKLNIFKNKGKNLKFKNILLNEIEILQKKILLKSKPRKLHVLLTTRCNLNCIMCYIPKNKSIYEIGEAFLKFIEKTIPYLETLTWQGGEVFLYNKFIPLFELAGKNGVKQNIITSGLMLNNKTIDCLIKYDTELTISIDSVVPKTYEKIRYGAHFEQLLKNLQILKEYKQIKQFSYNMTCVVMSLNYEEIENLVKFAVLYGFNLISFQKVLCNDNNKFLSLTFEQEKRVFENINKLKVQYSDLIKIQNDIICEEEHKHTDTAKTKTETEKIESAQKNLFCYDPWTQLFFDYDNILRVNCNSAFLNINKEEDIWNSSDLIAYRQSVVQNNFNRCNKLCYSIGCHL